MHPDLMLWLHQVLTVAKHGAVSALCSMLKSQDTKVLAVALEGIENVLKVINL